MSCNEHPICVLCRPNGDCLFTYEVSQGSSVGGDPPSHPPADRLQKVEALLSRLDREQLRAAFAAELKRREMKEVLGKLAELVDEETGNLRYMHSATARAQREPLLLDLVRNLAREGIR